MTIAIVDNKATAKKAYETFVIDREVYNTINDVMGIVAEMINKETYKIDVYEIEELDRKNLTEENKLFTFKGWIN